MFYLGPDFGIHDENSHYAHLFGESVHQSIYLTVCNPRMLFPASHYSFATNRNAGDVTRDEMADITAAMKVARQAFLQHFDVILMACSDSDLRSALGRSDNSFAEWVWRGTCEVSRAVREEVKNGTLVFVPTHED